MRKFLNLFIIFIAIGLITVFALPQIFLKLLYQLKFSEPSAYYELVKRDVGKHNLARDGVVYKYSNISFKVPWEAEVERAEREKFSKLSFSNEKVVILMADSLSVVQMLNDSKNSERLNKFFGGDSLRSDYDFYKAILQQTPADWNLLIPPRDTVAKFTTLIMKSSLLPATGATKGPIYEFNTGKVRGFLFQPSDKQKQIAEVFTVGSNSHYTLILERVTEEEADYIINSILRD